MYVGLKTQLMFKSTCLTGLVFLTYPVHHAIILRLIRISFALCIGTRIYLTNIPCLRTEDFFKEIKPLVNRRFS